MKVLLDINIILDICLKREKHFNHSFSIFQLINNWNINWYLSWISIDTISYILKKNWIKFSEIKNILKKLLSILNIATIDKTIVINAINSNFNDIEDALQYFSALNSWCNTIITRNKKDFKTWWNIQVLTPQEYIFKHW